MTTTTMKPKVSPAGLALLAVWGQHPDLRVTAKAPRYHGERILDLDLRLPSKNEHRIPSLKYDAKRLDPEERLPRSHGRWTRNELNMAAISITLRGLVNLGLVQGHKMVREEQEGWRDTIYLLTEEGAKLAGSDAADELLTVQQQSRERETKKAEQAAEFARQTDEQMEALRQIRQQRSRTRMVVDDLMDELLSDKATEEQLAAAIQSFMKVTRESSTKIGTLIEEIALAYRTVYGRGPLPKQIDDWKEIAR